MSDGVLTFKAFNCDISKVISSRGLDTGGKVQQYIDSEVLRLNEPFVPKDTGELIQSGIKNTEIGSGEVWDVEFPNKGWFIAGGMVVHNSGKCFAKGTKILMEDGSKKNVEDIKNNKQKLLQ